jgi:alanine-glyoxylate transaminase/serine-glyoxylate transaminase/serine-pyruvate transaminase
MPSAPPYSLAGPSSSSYASTAVSRTQQLAAHLSPTPSTPSTLRHRTTMSQPQAFTQGPHKVRPGAWHRAPTTHLFSLQLLVIPGPIEVADDVLLANAHPSMSHVSPDFVPVFGDCLRMLRHVLFAPEAQPVITAGSGTLGWDHVAANVCEPGDEVLVLNSGYFGDCECSRPSRAGRGRPKPLRLVGVADAVLCPPPSPARAAFAECLEVYGSKVTQLKAAIGSKPSLDEVEAALKAKKYKVLTFTHVDTSTAVLSDAKGLGELVQRVSPETVLVLDGVCSVASEEIRMADWGIDVVLTASQKGLGCPPGLMILAASKKAIAKFEARKQRPNSYYASWAKWLPVMKAYESG